MFDNAREPGLNKTSEWIQAIPSSEGGKNSIIIKILRISIFKVFMIVVNIHIAVFELMIAVKFLYILGYRLTGPLYTVSLK